MTTNDYIRALRIEVNKHFSGGRRIALQNYLDKVSHNLRKAESREASEPQDNDALCEQIAARYNARKAIFNAMVEGRHISLADSKEFQVSQMHTQVCFIRKAIADKSLPYEMQSRWINLGPNKRRVKEYWLELKNETTSTN